MEKWKDIVGYEGSYQVSNEGNIRSLDRISTNGKKTKGLILKQHKNIKTGYMYVGLCKNGKRKLHSVHRLVANAFIDNLNNLETVNHKNEIKTDNRAVNLEWMTLGDNLRYGTHTLRATLNKPSMRGPRHFNYGKRGSESHTHKGKVIGVNGQNVVEFDTAATAARELGISSGRICEALKNKEKMCAGYYWRRENG